MSPLATALLVALLVALALWWLGTGIVLYLQRRLARDGAAAAPLILLAGVVSALALALAARTTTPAASLVGFVAGIGLWGALELGHALGLVTGTHARPCPPGTRGWRRFHLALGASIWHELSVLGTALALLASVGDAPNPAGLYTFSVLWLARWSAKLNLFFGVPNFSTEWFPEPLAHLASYIRHAPLSPLYPASLTLAALGLIELGRRALGADDTAAVLAHALPAALLALAMLEHLFMALPIADTRLWNRPFGVGRDGADAASARARATAEP